MPGADASQRQDQRKLNIAPLSLTSKLNVRFPLPVFQLECSKFQNVVLRNIGNLPIHLCDPLTCPDGASPVFVFFQ
jgi:hypothetical protein